MKNRSKCPVCNSNVFFSIKNEINFDDAQKDPFLKAALEGYLSSHKPGEKINFNLKICMACQFIYKEPFFSDRELDNIYRYEYYSQERKLKNFEGFVYNNTFFLRTCANHASDIVNKIIHDDGGEIKKIFDIGGRDGFRLRQLAKNNYECIVFDPIPIDPCDPAIKKEYLFLNDIDVKKHSADLIILCNILEHCKNPKEVILKCRSLLNDNGYIFVQVPFDIPHILKWILSGKIQKKNFPIDFTHVLFFSIASLKYLLDSEGFNCISADIEFLPIIEGKSNVLVINILAKKTNEFNIPPKKILKHFSLCNFKLIHLEIERIKNIFYKRRHLKSY